MFQFLMNPLVRQVWGGDESELLRVQRDVWRQKPLVRRIYREWWTRMLAELTRGRTLEVGAGIGEFRRFYRGPLVSTDILPGARADLRCDAQRLPFRAGSFANVVCVDLVHHVERPLLFLREVERVLRPGGRFVAVEPYLSPLSDVIHRLFHHEASERAFAAGDGQEKSEALTADLRVPTDLFTRSPEALARACPGLRVRAVRPLQVGLAYPLSGGFTYRSLVPAPLVPVVDAFDRLLTPLERYLAFKLLVVVERVPADAPGPAAAGA